MCRNHQGRPLARARCSTQDWLRISEMLLGPAPASASGFTPKHKSNSYAASSELDMARG